MKVDWEKITKTNALKVCSLIQKEKINILAGQGCAHDRANKKSCGSSIC